MYPVATKKKVTFHQEELSSSSCVDHLIIILKTYLKNFEEMDNSLPGNSSKTFCGWMLQKKEKIPDQQPLCHCSCMDPVVRAETGDSSSIASEYNPTDILEYFV